MLDAEWFDKTYGIRWSASPQQLGGKLAQVFLVRDEVTRKRLVVRFSDLTRIDESRLAQIHRFVTSVSKRGIHTPLPLMTRSDRTVSVHGEHEDLVEVFTRDRIITTSPGRKVAIKTT